MRRFLTPILAGLLALASGADAATYDPQVAYVARSGKTSTLYLANADGTRAVAIWSAPNIYSLDLSPTGDRIAFVEGTTLKSISFTGTNTGITRSAPAVLATGATSVDFSDDGSRLIFRNANSISIEAVPATGGSAVVLSGERCYDPRWVRSSSLGKGYVCLSYPTGSSSVMQLHLVLLNADDSVASDDVILDTRQQAFASFEDFDLARTRDAVLVTAGYASGQRIIELDIATGVITDRGQGRRGHFSAGDARLLHIYTPASGVFIRSTDMATGITTTIAKKGSYNVVDARP